MDVYQRELYRGKARMLIIMILPINGHDQNELHLVHQQMVILMMMFVQWRSRPAFLNYGDDYDGDDDDND